MPKIIVINRTRSATCMSDNRHSKKRHSTYLFALRCNPSSRATRPARSAARSRTGSQRWHRLCHLRHSRKPPSHYPSRTTTINHGRTEGRGKTFACLVWRSPPTGRVFPLFREDSRIRNNRDSLRHVWILYFFAASTNSEFYLSCSQRECRSLLFMCVAIYVGFLFKNSFWSQVMQPLFVYSFFCCRLWLLQLSHVFYLFLLEWSKSFAETRKSKKEWNFTLVLFCF